MDCTILNLWNVNTGDNGTEAVVNAIIDVSIGFFLLSIYLEGAAATTALNLSFTLSLARSICQFLNCWYGTLCVLAFDGSFNPSSYFLSFPSSSRGSSSAYLHALAASCQRYRSSLSFDLTFCLPRRLLYTSLVAFWFFAPSTCVCHQ